MKYKGRKIMMNKKYSPLIIGSLLVLLTLVVFLVPNMNKVIESIVYVKMSTVILSIIIGVLTAMYLLNKKGLFLFSGFLGTVIIYFILNIAIILLVNSILLIVTFHLVLDIIFLITVFSIVKANMYVNRNSNKEKDDYSKAKSGSIY